MKVKCHYRYNPVILKRQMLLMKTLRKAQRKAFPNEFSENEILKCFYLIK